MRRVCSLLCACACYGRRTAPHLRAAQLGALGEMLPDSQCYHSTYFMDLVPTGTTTLPLEYVSLKHLNRLPSQPPCARARALACACGWCVCVCVLSVLTTMLCDCADLRGLWPTWQPKVTRCYCKFSGTQVQACVVFVCWHSLFVCCCLAQDLES